MEMKRKEKETKKHVDFISIFSTKRVPIDHDDGVSLNVLSDGAYA